MILPLLASISLAAPPASVATSSASSAATYRLIEEPGALYVLLKPKKSSLFGFLAHRHAIEARGYTGTVVYDPAGPTCRIEVDVPVEGLVVDPPGLREQEGFKKGISANDKETVREHMLKENQLFVERHPTIRFRSQTCEPLSRPGRFVVDGQLEIRGVARRVRVGVEVSFKDDEIAARSDFSEVHQSFGFEPYTAFGGTIRNDPMIQFRVRLRGRRAVDSGTP